MANNPDRYRASKEDYYSRKKGKISTAVFLWRHFSGYDSSAVNRRYREQNPEKFKRTKAAYRATSRGRAVHNESCRRALFSQKESTPAWADRDAILEFYANCPDGMQVDHIIPIKGELVCGLHVHENLQYLTRAENTAKWNKFDIAAE
jgi:5-methylcytosine-specific restriction endonuclease McrA